MHTQPTDITDTDIATIQCHVRHAHTLRSRAVLSAMGDLRVSLLRTMRTISTFFA